MRISGGIARGIPLAVPKGDAVRPSTDGMRQAVFSSLGARVPGAWFLDLFAGSGGYGLEALSRGAAGGVFVEQNAKAAACLRQNIMAVCKSVGCAPDALMVIQADARVVPYAHSTDSTIPRQQNSAGTRSPPAGGNAPDIVFVDPPYEIIDEIAPALFLRLAEVLASKPDAIVAFEAPGEIELAPPGWARLKRLGKGARQPTVSFFRRAETAAI